MEFGKHHATGVSRNTEYTGHHRENQLELGRLGYSWGTRAPMIIRLQALGDFFEERDSDPNIRR